MNVSGAEPVPAGKVKSGDYIPSSTDLEMAASNSSYFTDESMKRKKRKKRKITAWTAKHPCRASGLRWHRSQRRRRTLCRLFGVRIASNIPSTRLPTLCRISRSFRTEVECVLYHTIDLSTEYNCRHLKSLFLVLGRHEYLPLLRISSGGTGGAEPHFEAMHEAACTFDSSAQRPSGAGPPSRDLNQLHAYKTSIHTLDLPIILPVQLLQLHLSPFDEEDIMIAVKAYHELHGEMSLQMTSEILLNPYLYSWHPWEMGTCIRGFETHGFFTRVPVQTSAVMRHTLPLYARTLETLNMIMDSIPGIELAFLFDHLTAALPNLRRLRLNAGGGLYDGESFNPTREPVAPLPRPHKDEDEDDEYIGIPQDEHDFGCEIMQACPTLRRLELGIETYSASTAYSDGPASYIFTRTEDGTVDVERYWQKNYSDWGWNAKEDFKAWV
ncbi:hypothetical protein C8F01DRAFT_1311867 [Mycena amicta]|nr:hypothetical protein C8F01DRAFT_1311867 [Mycena amicta]